MPQSGAKDWHPAGPLQSAVPPKAQRWNGVQQQLRQPHAAGNDTESRDAMALSAARSIVALSRGEWPAEAIVNSEVRARFQW